MSTGSRSTAASAGPPTAATDPGTRGQILDAAIDCFARHGFSASVRAIAAAAGVSPGLITHHFGTKEALRAQCDSAVLTRYRTLKDDAVGAPSQYLRGLFPDMGSAPVLVVYIIRALAAGGAAGGRFLDQLVDELRVVMTHSVAAGIVRPSRDEEARLRTLVTQSMGGLLIEFMSHPEASPEEFTARITSSGHETLLPLLELYTEGLFTTPELLDTYLTIRTTPTPSPETDNQ